MELKPGDKAPSFTAKDEKGNPIRLSDFKGKKLVLFFYPKDDTEVCTRQACNLNDNLPSLSAVGYQVVGVSIDDEDSHQKFINKFGLNFPLIADTDKKLVNKYGVWREKTLYGHKFMGIVRTTFLIDEKGIITRIIAKVKSTEHSLQILK